MGDAVPADEPLAPSERRSILLDALGIGVATGAYGLSFGAISVAAGLDVAQTCALSLLMFTGGSQLALVGVLAGGGTLAAAGVSAVLLGVRNAFYGVRVAPLLAWRGPRRAGVAHLVIDESTAMAVARPTRAGARLAFLATGLSVFVLWNAATLVGALAGTVLGDPRDLGLDAAIGAAFLALVWPQLRGPRARAVGLASAALALALVPATPAGVPVLAAAGVALLAGQLPDRPDPAVDGA